MGPFLFYLSAFLRMFESLCDDGATTVVIS